jgi:3-isopropylmalate dehydrogenase
MSKNVTFRIAVLPGDGIGREVIPPCVALLNTIARQSEEFSFDFEEHQAGAFAYRETGSALPASTLEAARNADAILLGAMGWPDIRYPDGTEIAPQLDLRFELGLYAGVRPVRTFPNVRRVLADDRAANLDFVIIRESTEGLFASRGKGVIRDDQEASDTMVITRAVCEALFDRAFAIARQRQQRGSRGLVTCVDKANIFTSFAFFRKIFLERAALNSDIEARCVYVDAAALYLVTQPWEFDVLVTENMFGDILSDLGAGLMGGMGFAPSADIGDKYAVFQPCHGTAPDITGTGKANPIATFLSAAMMLDWLGQKHDLGAMGQAANRIRDAIDNAFASGLKPFEMGGTATTKEVTDSVLGRLQTEAARA